jgi:hypothetical protein
MSMALVLACSATQWRCSGTPSVSEDVAEFTYTLDRKFTGVGTNTLTIDVPGGSDDRYTFSLHSEDSAIDVEEDAWLPLESQTITLTYTTEGVHFADFKVQKDNGIPYVFEILTWEYSKEVPDAPIVSFAQRATRTLTNNLLVSDSRTSTTSGIWIQGDVSTAGKAEIEDGGFWEDLPLTTLAVPVTLSEGNDPKVVNAKFRNVFGNPGELGIPAEIILKQTPPTGCAAEAMAPIIANNKLDIKLNATDPYDTLYSIVGDVRAVVSQKTFVDDEIISVFVEPTEGNKTVTVYIEDIAGNVCLSQEINVELDPHYQSEGIFIDDVSYWTESEDITLSVFFNHFEDQEPLQIKLSGDVSGPNANTWLDANEAIDLSLLPTTTGSRRIFAQYKDVDGNESYLITKRVFLKPTITLQDTGGGTFDVVVSHILDAESLTITGCQEVYAAVAWAAAFTCEPNAVEVSVTYNFADDVTLTKSAAP